MPESYLEKLYYGNNANSQNTHVPKEWYDTINKITKFERSFYYRLSKNQKKKYNKFISLTGDITAIECKERFIEGFKLGFNIALECLHEKEEL